MNATMLLRQDHDEVRGIFSRIEAGKDLARCRELFGQLQLLLTAHTTIEQEIFYPAARSIPGLADLVAEAYADHLAVNNMLDAFNPEILGDEAMFRDKIKALQDTLYPHIADEEGEMFPKVEQACDKAQLDEMGKKLQMRKDELMKALPAEV